MVRVSNFFALIVTLLLLGGCTGGGDGFPRELVEGDLPPRAESVQVNGTLISGETLTVSYRYEDPNPKPRPEGATIVEWRDADDNVLTQGASLLLTPGAIGKRLKVCVTPVAQGSAKTVGKTSCSILTLAISSKGSAPEARDVVADPSSNLHTGQMIYGGYQYFDADGDPEGNTTFVWRANGDDIPGETNTSLLLTNVNSEGKSIQFCVTPKSSISTDDAPLAGKQTCSDATTRIDPPRHPIAWNLATRGEPIVGQRLYGKYLFIDQNNPAREEEESRFLWQRLSDDEILARGSNKFLVTDDLIGDAVRFCVEPVADGNSNTLGEIVCSPYTPTIIDVSGFRPEARNVSISVNDGLTVGSSLTGQYIYFDADDEAEGNTSFEWRADGKVLKGETSRELLLTTDNSEGKVIEFCVTPRSQQATIYTPVTGWKVCANTRAAVASKAGEPPLATKVQISGGQTAGSTLYGSYVYSDIELDVEGKSQYRWLRDGVELSAVDTASYVTQTGDAAARIQFCVTPRSASGSPNIGKEKCSADFGPIKTPQQPPSVSTNIEGDPLPGNTLRGKYAYAADGGGEEGRSIVVWRVGSEVFSGLEYTVRSQDVGRNLGFCVTPINTGGESGVESCRSAFIAGIRMSGSLTYNGVLVAEPVGLSGPVRWRIDVSNNDGPVGDRKRTLVPGPNKGLVFVIGNRFLAFYDGLVRDINANGLIDDIDWQDAIDFGTAPELDARRFLGKDVEFCVDDSRFGEVCIEASQQAGVRWGIYYDAFDVTRRGIEPQRHLALPNAASSVILHRPLSVAETQLADEIGLGKNLPRAFSSDGWELNGLNWARFVHAPPRSNSPAIFSCLNLTSGQVRGRWSQPLSITGVSGINDDHTSDGNRAPTGRNEGLRDLYASKLWAPAISYVFGWPTQPGYWTPSIPRDGVHRAFNFSSGATSEIQNSEYRFVTCSRIR